MSVFKDEGMKKTVSAILLLCVLLGGTLYSESSVALAGIENTGGDPRYDYLTGIVEGLLLFDFSRSPGVKLVNRNKIEDVLDEQRMVLSGLIADDEKAVEIGRLAGADFLVHGSYVFIGLEVLFSLTITDVETGTAIAVTDRGATENAVHRLAEKAVAAISGARVTFATPETDRSILSLQDEKPGEIAFHSNLMDAEIYLDGKFVGYTGNDSRIPFVISNVAPGSHTIMTDLGADFGTVDLPEVIFRNWSATVQVTPGGRIVVRGKERHFNSFLYDMQKLFHLSKTMYADRDPELQFAEDLTFTDRQGNEVVASVEGKAEFADGTGTLFLDLRHEGEVRHFELSTAEEENKVEAEFGLMKLKLEIKSSNRNSCSLTVYIDRTDVYQGLHREEGKQD